MEHNFEHMLHTTEQSSSYSVRDSSNGCHVAGQFSLLLTSVNIPKFQVEIVWPCHLQHIKIPLFHDCSVLCPLGDNIGDNNNNNNINNDTVWQQNLGFKTAQYLTDYWSIIISFGFQFWHTGWHTMSYYLLVNTQ